MEAEIFIIQRKKSSEKHVHWRGRRKNGDTQRSPAGSKSNGGDAGKNGEAESSPADEAAETEGKTKGHAWNHGAVHEEAKDGFKIKDTSSKGNPLNGENTPNNEAGCKGGPQINFNQNGPTPMECIQEQGNGINVESTTQEGGGLKKRKRTELRKEKEKATLKPISKNMKKTKMSCSTTNNLRKKVKLRLDLKKGGSRKGKKENNLEILEDEVRRWENESVIQDEGNSEWGEATEENMTESNEEGEVSGMEDRQSEGLEDLDSEFAVKDTFEAMEMGKKLGINFNVQTENVEVLVKEKETTIDKQ